MKPPNKATSDFDEGSNSVVIGVISAFRNELETFQRSNSDDRAAFKVAIEDSLIQLRKDFHRAIISVALDNADHKQQHVNDTKDRIERQMVIDLNFADLRKLIFVSIGAIVVLLVILIVAIALAVYLWSTLLWRIVPIA